MTTDVWVIGYLGSEGGEIDAVASSREQAEELAVAYGSGVHGPFPMWTIGMEVPAPRYVYSVTCGNIGRWHGRWRIEDEGSTVFRISNPNQKVVPPGDDFPEPRVSHWVESDGLIGLTADDYPTPEAAEAAARSGWDALLERQSA